MERRRRSALRLVEEGDGAEAAVPTGRRKRVSFSTDLAKVRKFQNTDGDDDDDDWTADDKGTDFFYKPPEDDLTVNFDPAAQDTLMFATGLKTSSTPEHSSRVSKKRSSLLKPVKSAANESVAWVNPEGHVYHSLSAARAHGETKSSLKPVTMDMEETNLAGGHSDHTTMNVTAAAGKKKPKGGTSAMMEMTCQYTNSLSDSDSIGVLTRGGTRKQWESPESSGTDVPSQRGSGEGGSHRRDGRSEPSNSYMDITDDNRQGRRSKRRQRSSVMELSQSSGKETKRSSQRRSGDSEDDKTTGEGGSRRRDRRSEPSNSYMDITDDNRQGRRTKRRQRSSVMELSQSRGKETKRSSQRQSGDSEDDKTTGEGGSRRRDRRSEPSNSYMDITDDNRQGRRSKGRQRSSVMDLSQSRGKETKRSSHRRSGDSEDDKTTDEMTMEMYRKLAVDVSTLPSVPGELSIVRPKASAVMDTQYTSSRVKVETKKADVSVEEPIELMDNTPDDCAPLKQVLTARSTTAAAFSDDSSEAPDASRDVMEEELPTIDSQDQSLSEVASSHSMSTKSWSSRQRSARVSGRRRSNSVTSESSRQNIHRRRSKSLSPRKTRSSSQAERSLSNADQSEVSRSDEEEISALKQELAEARALLEECEAVAILEEQVVEAQKRSDALSKQLEEADRQYEQVGEDVDKRLEQDEELNDITRKLDLHEKLRIWSYESEELNKMTFKFKLGVKFDIATLCVSVTVDSLATANIEQADAELRDVLTGHSMPSYRLQPCLDLLELSQGKCREYLKTDRLPLMLFDLTALVLRLNALLKEFERSYIRLGWFTFDTPNVLTYRVSKRTDWSCYYHMKGLDLHTYPDSKLSFTYEPHLGNVPERMRKILPSLEEIPTGKLYLTRVANAIRASVLK